MDATALLKLHEGYRRHPYTCPAGALTVGYGRNLDDVGIDPEEAAYLLERDIERARAVLRLEPYWLDLDEVRQAVLLDMCVNLGWPRLQLFRRMRQALRMSEYHRAAAEMVDSAWYEQVGQRSRRLVEMMRSGEWQA